MGSEQFLKMLSSLCSFVPLSRERKSVEAYGCSRDGVLSDAPEAIHLVLSDSRTMLDIPLPQACPSPVFIGIELLIELE